MKILNGHPTKKLQPHEIRKINNFLIHHHQDVSKSLIKNGRPAWMMNSGKCFWLNDRNRIKDVSIRELIEKGYNFLSEKRINRFCIWTITKDDMVSRLERENEEAAELEAEMSDYWSDKMSIKIGPPSSYKLMNSIK